MALLDWSRSRDPFEDRAVVELLHRATAAIEPDPMYRRRLRGLVLNAHVARREGLVRSRPPRQMGAVGRSVLVASLTLAVSVSAVGAVAQEALPGDVLYPVKRELEAIRLQIASGAARDDLLAQALSARLDEYERLAAAGDWQRADTAEAEVIAAEVAVELHGQPPTPEQQARARRHVDRLEALLQDAPAAQQNGLRRALQVAEERAAATPRPAPGVNAQRPSTPLVHASTPPSPASEPPGQANEPGAADEQQARGSGRPDQPLP